MIGKKRKGKEETMRLNQNIQKTEWVLCSEDWGDIVITYVPQLNNLPIEDNCADISLEEIKDAYIKYAKWRKPRK